MADSPNILNLERGDLLFTAGDTGRDLYIIDQGQVLVCMNKGTQITPLAFLEDGAYLGELSFIDGMPRNAHVIATKPTKIVRVPHSELEKQIPAWLITIGSNICRKLRNVDEIINKRGLRRVKAKSMRALTIDEQRSYLQFINEYRVDQGLPKI